jgi:hydrogenase nickel incorporation protein HypA/HybF
MHELPIVLDVIKIVNQEAEERGLSKIKSITLVIGELSSVMDESVQMYFELLAEGTHCKGARLVFEHVPSTLRCVRCGNEFPHIRKFECPLCGGDSVLIKGTGQECYIKSIDGE